MAPTRIHPLVSSLLTLKLALGVIGVAILAVPGLTPWRILTDLAAVLMPVGPLLVTVLP